MEEDEQEDDWADQTVHWTQGVPSCSIRDECLWVLDQVGEDVSDEDIAEQSLINEKACAFETSERDYSGETYEQVLEFGQSFGKCWPTVWGWDAGPTAFKFLNKELGDIDGFSQQFNIEWEVDY